MTRSAELINKRCGVLESDGSFSGSNDIESLWESSQDYIEKNFDHDVH